MSIFSRESESDKEISQVTAAKNKEISLLGQTFPSGVGGHATFLAQAKVPHTSQRSVEITTHTQTHLRITKKYVSYKFLVCFVDADLKLSGTHPYK